MPQHCHGTPQSCHTALHEMLEHMTYIHSLYRHNSSIYSCDKTQVAVSTAPKTLSSVKVFWLAECLWSESFLVVSSGVMLSLRLFLAAPIFTWRENTGQQETHERQGEANDQCWLGWHNSKLDQAWDSQSLSVAGANNTNKDSSQRDNESHFLILSQ